MNNLILLLLSFSGYLLFYALGYLANDINNTFYPDVFRTALSIISFILFLVVLFNSHRSNFVGIILIIITVLVSFNYAIFVDSMKFIFKNFASVLGALSIFVFVKIIIKDKIPLVYEYLGKISYELFLIHGAFMYSYDFILYKLPLQYSFFIYMVFIVALSVILKKVFNQVNIFFSRRLVST